MGKTLLVYNMNLKEMENYEKIYTDIGESSICRCNGTTLEAFTLRCQFARKFVSST